MIQARREVVGGFEPRMTLAPNIKGTVRHELTLKNVGNTPQTLAVI